MHEPSETIAKQPSETLKKAIALVGGRLAEPLPEAIKNLPEPALEVANQVMQEMVENWKPTPFVRAADTNVSPRPACVHDPAGQLAQCETCGPRDGTVTDLPACHIPEGGKTYSANLKEEIIELPDGTKGLGNVEHPSVAQTLAEDALKPKDKPMTEIQFRALRRAFFTVRHLVLPDCGHKLDQINQPKNNCEYCWWAFFSSHGELVQVTDRAFQEQGSDFLDKMRGVKYRKMFFRYMSTLARLQKEAAELAEKEKLNGGNEGTEGEVRSDQQSGNSAGQEVRADGDVSIVREESGEGNTVNPDGVSIG